MKSQKRKNPNNNPLGPSAIPKSLAKHEATEIEIPSGGDLPAPIEEKAIRSLSIKEINSNVDYKLLGSAVLLRKYADNPESFSLQAPRESLSEKSMLARDLALSLTIFGLAEVHSDRIAKLQKVITVLENKLFNPATIDGFTPSELLEAYRLVLGATDNASKYVMTTLEKLDFSQIRNRLISLGFNEGEIDTQNASPIESYEEPIVPGTNGTVKLHDLFTENAEGDGEDL